MQIFWTDIQFQEKAPNSTDFRAALQLGMKQGLEGQTKLQDKVTLWLTLIFAAIFKLFLG